MKGRKNQRIEKEIDDVFIKNAKGIFLLMDGPKRIGTLVRYLSGEDTNSRRGQVNSQIRRLFNLKLGNKRVINNAYDLTILASTKKGREIFVKEDGVYIHDKRIKKRELLEDVLSIIANKLVKSLIEENKSELVWETSHKHEIDEIGSDLNELLKKTKFRELAFDSGFWTKAFNDNEKNDKVFFPFRSLIGFVNFALLTLICRYYISKSSSEYKINYSFLLNTLIGIVSKNSYHLYSDNVGNSTKEEIQRFANYYKMNKNSKDIGSMLRHFKKHGNIQTLNNNIEKKLAEKIGKGIKEDDIKILIRYYSLYFDYPFQEMIQTGLDIERVVPFMIKGKIPLHRLLQLDYRSRLEHLLF